LGFGGGELDSEGGAFVGFAGGGDGAAVAGDGAVADGEAQAGAFADGLGGEEGFEESFEVFGGDAGAVVGDIDDDGGFVAGGAVTRSEGRSR